MPPNPLSPTFKIPLFTLIFLLTTLPPTNQYIDLPLTITRPQKKTGQISYAFQIDVQGYKQNITISLSNSHPDSVTPVSDMKKIYKQKKLKKSNYKSTKNHNNVFGLLEVSSLEGYTFEGWKRYFMEVFLYVESRYFHQIQVNLDDVVGGGDDEHQAKLGEALSNGVMSLGPKLKENKIYQEIKKNTDLISFDIIAIYSGVGQRNNRLQLGGYQQQYARGDAKTGALLYQFPLKATQNHWQLAVQKVYFTRSKSKKTDQFLLHTQPNLYRLSLQQQYITFPQSMRSSIQSYVQSQNNQCKFGQFLQCNNMSTIDISLSEFAFQLTPNYFINVSLYDLRRDYEPETKRVSFYIRLSQDIDQIQIGAAILKEYYIAIDMNQPALLYSGINRFKSQFSSVYVLRFFAYFIVFTLVMAIIVGIWANFSDPNRRNKLRYGRQGIQLVSYQRPGGIFINNQQIDQ